MLMLVEDMRKHGYGVESDLVNSLAWDTTLKFMSWSVGNFDYINDTSLHKLESGQMLESCNDVVCNVRDMKHGYDEWTTESYSSSDNSIARGSHCCGWNKSAARRSGESVKYKKAPRCILYLK